MYSVYVGSGSISQDYSINVEGVRLYYAFFVGLPQCPRGSALAWNGAADRAENEGAPDHKKLRRGDQAAFLQILG